MEADTAAAVPVALFKKRGNKGRATLRKRPATPPPATASSDSDGFSSSEDESGRRIKRRKTTGAITASSKTASIGSKAQQATTHLANRDVPITDSNDATRQIDWYDDKANNVLSEKKLLGSSRSRPTDSQPDGTYKGLANRATFIQKNPDAPQRNVGPIKAPTNIRTVTVLDFAPDVCKDYKKTGFCGFGDNCKYLHSREDYKHGWQMDQEWDVMTKGKTNLAGTVVASANRSKGAVVGDDDDQEDAFLQNIPFVCIICEGPYRSPIVTRCGHYFCEPCALNRYRRDPTCAACGAGTNGVFNAAKRLTKLLAMKREREAKRKQAAREAGETVSSDDDDG